MRPVIYIICLVSAIYGMVDVSNTLRVDNETAVRETGLVTLPVSYWYEHYEVREMFAWLRGREHVPVVGDKAAWAVYGREYRIGGIGGNLALTAYPAVLRRQGYTLTPVAGRGFMRVYEVRQ